MQFRGGQFWTSGIQAINFATIRQTFVGRYYKEQQLEKNLNRKNLNRLLQSQYSNAPLENQNFLKNFGQTSTPFFLCKFKYTEGKQKWTIYGCTQCSTDLQVNFFIFIYRITELGENLRNMLHDITTSECNIQNGKRRKQLLSVLPNFILRNHHGFQNIRSWYWYILLPSFLLLLESQIAPYVIRKFVSNFL